MNTLCPYCGVGCGIKVDGRKIKGDHSHPSSSGDLCKKPLYLVDTLSKGRVKKPLFRESKRAGFREIEWSEAVKILASKITKNRADENYFYLSGQLLTEESYLINKFVKGFVGTSNVDANSRLCMASAVVAHKMAFGSDGPLGSYDDIDDSDLFVFAGSNPAIAHPVVFKRVIRQKRTANAKIVVIDPLFTESAERADMHIAINAGTDTAFFNCILGLLSDMDNEATKYAKSFTIEKTSNICGVPKKQIEEFAALFEGAKKVISFWCQGLNQSTNGVYKNLSLINLHIATDRLASRGMPFSLTGQPNAMGGREVGYLSNGLPGYRDVRVVEDRALLESFWNTPQKISDKPGLTVTKAIDASLEGRIKLFWSVCTNPAVSLPHLNKVFDAFAKEELFLVVQDAYFTDTAKYANLILPAAQWGEKEGTMTNSERVVSHLKEIFEPCGDSKSDWEIFALVAKKIGFLGFEYQSVEEIYLEYRELTKNRLCDISKISYADMPKRWGNKTLYGDGSKKAVMHKAIFEMPLSKMGYEFVLTTGRLKNQWHTMTRTGKSEELLRDESTPYCLINKEDAERLGVKDGDKKTIISAEGKLRAPFVIGNIKEGHLFMPFGWGAKKSIISAIFRSDTFEGAVNVLMPDDVDTLSFQPELKFARVKVV